MEHSVHFEGRVGPFVDVVSHATYGMRRENRQYTVLDMFTMARKCCCSNSTLPAGLLVSAEGHPSVSLAPFSLSRDINGRVGRRRRQLVYNNNSTTIDSIGLYVFLPVEVFSFPAQIEPRCRPRRRMVLQGNMCRAKTICELLLCCSHHQSKQRTSIR